VTDRKACDGSYRGQSRLALATVRPCGGCSVVEEDPIEWKHVLTYSLRSERLAGRNTAMELTLVDN
jgi:hypothetical protein